MESLKRHWPYLIAALALSGIGYYFYLRFAARSKSANCFPIKFGNSTPNDCVRRWQRYLNDNSSEPIAEDGLWGPITVDAIHAAGLPGYAYGPITADEYKELTAS